ncbi:MAG: hypothetical protein RJB19_343, partial [Pseudomonadota bacterium]
QMRLAISQIEQLNTVLAPATVLRVETFA